MEYIPAIISAIGAIIAAWFTYNQYTKNKMTDLNIEKWKKEEVVKSAEKSEHISKIYGELWQLLHYLKADRVYIIQPHPLINSLFISISLEVKRNGVAEMKKTVGNMPMADVALFSSELSKRDWMYYKDIDSEVKDKRAKSIMGINGTLSAAIKRLSDDEKRWIGSLFVDFTHEENVLPDYIRKLMTEAASNIQYILPEYKPN